MVRIIRHTGVLPLLLSLLSACAAPTPYREGRDQSDINPLRIPVEPVLWSGIFSCTAYTEGGLPAISWRKIPFRQEGDHLTGLYTFKDSFGYQDSVELTGSPVSMTGQMMSGTSQHPVRSCTLALTTAK